MVRERRKNDFPGGRNSIGKGLEAGESLASWGNCKKFLAVGAWGGAQCGGRETGQEGAWDGVFTPGSETACAGGSNPALQGIAALEQLVLGAEPVPRLEAR